MKTDTLFYRLFQRWPKLALELVGLDYRSESYRFSSEEIKQTAFRLDGVFTPIDDDSEQPLIFAEVQYQPDDDFYGRFFSEITLYLRLHKPTHPWLALVIYPTRSTEKPASIAFRPFMDLPQLRRVYLDDYVGRQKLTPPLELIRLIASHKQQTMAIARELADRRDEFGPDGLDFIETILVYKLPRLSREEIKSMLALNEIELKQTRFYQDVIEEGRQEGEKKGRQEGEQILLQRMLTRRFGQMPDWAQARLQQAAPEQLEQWADRLLDAPTLDAVLNGQ
ncbi:MAG: Rpn family recombination-promoting nuclease/putative transposase [Methylobacter sp.]|nr:Rpn family recombination-promoting nuclease/putative transposase [Methylobacter sp.]MDP2099447.1 Rpn family recombination-promoting nuclease/putative transposase [Methylobacter sp.]MDP2429687.1 Rpn family recombination-promoting nuclease/putative transposase [Methylobacter sp.]MDP3055447.1 Rpn family recombination-promoting nuclease/putative transposase [Methylobacter sp.]MDP3363338.1 Rpn family recombination-promoting nuclease/putative transposase [Methylobacter sp.]